MVSPAEKTLATLQEHFMVDGNPVIDPDGKVHASNDVVLYNKFHTPFEKLPVEFSHIGGTLMVSNNTLKTLEGCPKTLGRSFECDSNELKTLEFGPKQIGLSGEGGHYICSQNQLVNLVGAPREIPGVFNCAANPLKSLKGFPQKIGRLLYITYDSRLPLLRTLAAPEIIFWPLPNADSDAVKVLNILKYYLSKGTRAMFDCQKALEDAGFEENARW